MTMPHLMNCEHSEEGWCLSCVKSLHDRAETIASMLLGKDYEVAMKMLGQTVNSNLSYPNKCEVCGRGVYKSDGRPVPNGAICTDCYVKTKNASNNLSILPGDSV